MNSDTVLLLTFWVMTGAFIGGVVTPVIAANKRVDDWLAMVIGVVVGAVGNVILLAALWLLIWMQADRGLVQSTWRADTSSLDEVLASVGAGGSPAAEMTAMLRANFWPAPLASGHSHRITYVGVFAALAVITFVEVLLTVLSLPFPVTGPLVALSTSKVLLVVLYFMHLRYDSPIYAAIFSFALPFAFLVVAVLALAA